MDFVLNHGKDDTQPAKKRRGEGAKAHSVLPQSAAVEGPTNKLVTPLLTDMYQVSMAYAYWKSQKHNDNAVFDLFFRKCPFKGEFCIFAGLDEIMKYLPAYKFTESDIDYIRGLLPAEPEFFDWLLQIDCSEVKVYAVPEVSLV